MPTTPAVFTPEEQRDFLLRQGLDPNEYRMEGDTFIKNAPANLEPTTQVVNPHTGTSTLAGAMARSAAMEVLPTAGAIGAGALAVASLPVSWPAWLIGLGAAGAGIGAGYGVKKLEDKAVESISPDLANQLAIDQAEHPWGVLAGGLAPQAAAMRFSPKGVLQAGKTAVKMGRNLLEAEAARVPVGPQELAHLVTTGTMGALPWVQEGVSAYQDNRPMNIGQTLASSLAGVAFNEPRSWMTRLSPTMFPQPAPEAPTLANARGSKFESMFEPVPADVAKASAADASLVDRFMEQTAKMRAEQEKQRVVELRDLAAQKKFEDAFATKQAKIDADNLAKAQKAWNDAMKQKFDAANAAQAAREGLITKAANAQETIKGESLFDLTRRQAAEREQSAIDFERNQAQRDAEYLAQQKANAEAEALRSAKIQQDIQRQAEAQAALEARLGNEDVQAKLGEMERRQAREADIKAAFAEQERIKSAELERQLVEQAKIKKTKEAAQFKRASDFDLLKPEPVEPIPAKPEHQVKLEEAKAKQLEHLAKIAEETRLAEEAARVEKQSKEGLLRQEAERNQLAQLEAQQRAEAEARAAEETRRKNDAWQAQQNKANQKTVPPEGVNPRMYRNQADTPFTITPEMAKPETPKAEAPKPVVEDTSHLTPEELKAWQSIKAREGAIHETLTKAGAPPSDPRWTTLGKESLRRHGVKLKAQPVVTDDAGKPIAGKLTWQQTKGMIHDAIAFISKLRGPDTMPHEAFHRAYREWKLDSASETVKRQVAAMEKMIEGTPEFQAMKKMRSVGDVEEYLATRAGQEHIKELAKTSKGRAWRDFVSAVKMRYGKASVEDYVRISRRLLAETPYEIGAKRASVTGVAGNVQSRNQDDSSMEHPDNKAQIPWDKAQIKDTAYRAMSKAELDKRVKYNSTDPNAAEPSEYGWFAKRANFGQTGSYGDHIVEFKKPGLKVHDNSGINDTLDHSNITRVWKKNHEKNKWEEIDYAKRISSNKEQPAEAGSEATRGNANRSSDIQQETPKPTASAEELRTEAKTRYQESSALSAEEVHGLDNGGVTDGPKEITIRAYHGTPHEVRGGFSLDKIGTGEGAQAYGWGLYFAENKGVAEGYAKELSSKQGDYYTIDGKPIDYIDSRSYYILDDIIQNGYNKAYSNLLYNIEYYKKHYSDKDHTLYNLISASEKDLQLIQSLKNKKIEHIDESGNTYQVRLHGKPEEFLDFDKPLSTTQKDYIIDNLPSLNYRSEVNKANDGMEIYSALAKYFGKDITYAKDIDGGYQIRSSNEKAASEYLASLGIKGIRYEDAGSRGNAGEKTFNYVVFDPKNISIVSENGKAMPVEDALSGLRSYSMKDVETPVDKYISYEKQNAQMPPMSEESMPVQTSRHDESKRTTRYQEESALSSDEPTDDNAINYRHSSIEPIHPDEAAYNTPIDPVWKDTFDSYSNERLQRVKEEMQQEAYSLYDKMRDPKVEERVQHLWAAQDYVRNLIKKRKETQIRLAEQERSAFQVPEEEISRAVDTDISNSDPEWKALSKAERAASAIQFNIGPWKTKNAGGSVVDRIRSDVDSPTGDYVASKAKKYFDLLSENIGRYANSFLSDIKLSRMTAAERKEARDFLVNQDVERGPLDTSALSPRVQAYIEDVFRPAYVAIHEDQRAKGITINGREAKDDPYHFPSVLDQKVFQAIRENPHGEVTREAKDAWVEHLVTKRDVDRNEAIKIVDDYFDAILKNKKVDSFSKLEFNAIRKAEGYGMPESIRSKDLYDTLNRYGRRVAKDFAYYEALQKDPAIRKALGISDQDGHANTANAKLPDGSDVEKIGGEAVDNLIASIAGDWRHADSKLLAAAKVFNSGIMQTVTRLRDIVQHVGVAAPYIKPTQSATYLTAIGNVAKNWDIAFRYGAYRKNMNEMRFTMDDHVDRFMDYADKLSYLLNTVTGANKLDQFGRVYAFSQGELVARSNYEAARAGSKSSEKWLKELSNDATIPENPTDDYFYKIAKQFVDKVQGTYDARGLPMGVLDSAYAPFVSLQRWSIERTNRVYNDVWKPLKQGNPTPFLMYTIGSFVGAAAVKEMVNYLNSGKKRNEPTMQEAIAMDNKEQMAHAAVSFMQMGSYLGFYGDIMKMASDARNLRKPMGVGFPIVSYLSDELVPLLAEAGSAISNGEAYDKVVPKLVEELMKGAVQDYRLYWNATHPEKIEKMNKYRDMRVHQTLSGEPRNSFVIPQGKRVSDLDAKEFKETTDMAEAQALLPSLISDALAKSHGDPYKLKAELTKIKSNSYQTLPDPSTMPIAFASFMQFLSRTQGPDEANRRLVDWMTRRQINKAKSAMVPSLDTN